MKTIRRNRGCKTLLAGALLAALATLLAPAARAAEPVGRVRGVVREAGTNSLLPAVTITATSRALLGGPRVWRTNDKGRYELPDLPPGEYQIEFSYAGVEPTVRRVIVRQ